MRYAKCFVLLVIILPLMSCWDKTELENRDYVLLIGVDKSEDADSRYTISMSVADTGSEKGEETKASFKTANSKTLSNAMSLTNAYSSKSVYYGHTKAVILGKELLEDETLLREAVDALERNRALNRRIKLLAADDRASDILNAQTEEKLLAGMYISNFFKNNANTINITTEQDLERLIKDLRATGNTLLPKISVPDGEWRIGGVCVIKNFKLVGYLDDRQTKGLLWLKDKGNGAQITAKLDDAYIPFRVNNSTVSMDFYENMNKNGLICAITVYAEGSLDEYTITSKSLSDGDSLNTLKTMYADIIADEIYTIMDFFQNELSVDALALSEILRKYHYTLYNKYFDNSDYEWEQVFCGMETVLDIDISIVNTGAIK